MFFYCCYKINNNITNFIYFIVSFNFLLPISLKIKKYNYSYVNGLCKECEDGDRDRNSLKERRDEDE